MSKQFMAVLAAIIIILGGIFIFAKHDTKAPGSSNSGKPTQHIEGQGKAGVTLVEYGDYQCPACGEYYQPLKQVFAKYSKQIYFQFRNYPLTSLHPNAFAGARAAEAAGMQNKYWQMHDLLYENQQTWSSASDPLSIFTQMAQSIGLNLTKFKQDYISSAANDNINADQAAGKKLNITGTPTFIIDGKKIDNPSPTVDAFSQIIDAAIAKKAGQQSKQPATTTPSSSANQPAPAQTKAKQ